MIKENKDFPILEFDDNRKAIIDPILFADKPFKENKMIITFFPEVIKKLLSENKIFLERTIPGENDINVYKFIDDDILLVLGVVGCPSCAGNLDMFNSMGITKVMFCGAGGALDNELEAGKLLIVEGSIRDEGFSYHYVKPSKYIYSNKTINDKIADYLKRAGIPYIIGLTWTTDAIFRETEDRIKLRKRQGANMVEMEQAGCLAVAQFRGFDYGSIIYSGDDVSNETWENRGWREQGGVRYNLVNICKELLHII